MKYQYFNILFKDYLTNGILNIINIRITLPTKIFAMKKNFLFSFLFIASLTSINSEAQSVFKDTNIDKFISEQPISKDKDLNYVGSPYANEEFEKGIVVKNGLTIAHNIGLRYNANKDFFEIKKKFALKDNQAKLLKKTDEIVLKINDENFVYIPATESNNVFGYFVLLHKGENISLLKKIKKEFIPGQKAFTSMATDVQPTYKEKITLFISDKEGVITPLPNSKNKKIETFNKDKKAIKLYIKENKLNLNKEKDLIKLTAYLDTI